MMGMSERLLAMRERALKDIELFTHFGPVGIADWAAEKERMMEHLRAVVATSDRLLAQISVEPAKE